MNFANVTNIRIPQGEVIQIQDSLSRVLWKKSSPTVLPYFYVEDMSGNNNIVSIIKTNINAPTLTIEKSTDGINWSTMGSTSTTAITSGIPANGKLYLRCSTRCWSKQYQSSSAAEAICCSNKINCDNSYKVGGNIMSLLYGSSFTGNETSFKGLYSSEIVFSFLFSGSTSLISSSDLVLPARSMVIAESGSYNTKWGCYSSMFMDCISLTTAPTLPATTLADHCYANMFQNCTSLTVAPALSAETMAISCYNGMFQNCTSLTTAPTLPAKTLDVSCYDRMFYNCISLTAAPELPATYLHNYCYRYMFGYCGSLNNIKCLATNLSANNCLEGWVTGVSQTGTFTKKAGITYPSGASGIPSGWTVIEV